MHVGIFCTHILISYYMSFFPRRITFLVLITNKYVNIPVSLSVIIKSASGEYY